MSERPALVVEHVSARLAGRTVLDDVSFTVGPGQFTGLIGSNGAGKTTLFRLILGLRAGRIGGRVTLAPGGRGRSAAIGYVPQKFSLDPDVPLRARDLVALGIDGERLGFARPSARRRARVQAALDSVGAGEFADARVGELSGGEQQRVLIAHALISEPRLLLLDEPLANLDLRSAGEVVALVARLAGERGLAVLISAHEINPLLPVMDRVVYLAGGHAVHGRVEEVIRADVLTGLYGHPVDVLHVHGRLLVVAGVGGPAAGEGAGGTAGVEVLT